MVNGDLNAFIDAVYCGEELLVLYRGEKYFIQGWTTQEGVKHLECWLYEDAGKPYIWKRDSSSMAENAREFLAAPLWDGMPFAKAESEMEWIDE